MWFGKAIDDFNAGIESQGADGPQLVASVGNGFTSESTYPFHGKPFAHNHRPVVYVAYSFLAVPLVCSLAKLHVLAGK